MNLRLVKPRNGIKKEMKKSFGDVCAQTEINIADSIIARIDRFITGNVGEEEMLKKKF